MDGPVRIGTRAAAQVLAGLVLAIGLTAGCAPTIADVKLPKKGPLTAPALDVGSSAWTHAQVRVERAYHAAQVALEQASATQNPARARTILTPYILPGDVANFIALMSAVWRKGEISGGSMDYQVLSITIKGPTALIETCWPIGSADLESAATGKRVGPPPVKARHSTTLMGLINGHWLQGRSVLDPAPCS
jgi:hypothetical protein